MANSDIVNKIYDMLKIKLGTESHTHTEIINQAKMLASFVFGCDDEDIIETVVVRYEENHPLVKVTAPDILVANEDDGKWFEKKQQLLSHSMTDGYFDRYKRYLRRQDFSEAVIDQMESDCARVLKQCANPEMTLNVNERKKKGLVVGDVQSGKTANYLGLINMACDFGYKIIVLLAGMTDSLRQQTQTRVDSGFIGAVSDTMSDAEITYIGVSDDAQIQQNYAVPLTNNENDFVKFVKKNLNATSGDFNKPIILVVKKNTSVLKQVVEWLKPGFHNINCQNIFIIDDEADNASINTKKPECDPSAINGHIRNLYNNFPIASYVGYTATPFANIFVNPEGDESYKDLFPSDFIVLLNAPSNYYGAQKVFAYDGDVHSRSLRVLNEGEEHFLPAKHKKDEYRFTELADSLKEAILCFLINNVIRTKRGANKKHRSMLINISVFNIMHGEILETVKRYVEKLRNIIEQDSQKNLENFIKNEEMKRLYQIFTGDVEYLDGECDFYGDLREKISWEEIQAGLYDEITKFEVVVINNQNKKERFSYNDSRFGNAGARVIVVGGYVLSRGLTLEGLMVSYFSRSSTAYDSLLQMCRWFGYRPNYEDLCRVYMTPANIMNFRAVIDAVEDLKMQFREMIVKKKKPDDFGLMVRESPDTLETSLLITSRNKMYNSGKVIRVLKYGGMYSDTSKLYCSKMVNEANGDVIKSLFDSCTSSGFVWKDYLSADSVAPRKMLRDIPSKVIADHIKRLKIPFENTKFDVDNLSVYIKDSAAFPKWDIVIARGAGDIFYEGSKVVVRSFTKVRGEKIIRVGNNNNRIIDPGIFASGLTEDELEEVRAKSAGGAITVPDYLSVKTRNPLFVIYPMQLNPVSDNEEERQVVSHFWPDGEDEKKPVFGFAVGFPNKETAEKMTYRANTRKIQEIEASREEPEVDEEFYSND